MNEYIFRYRVVQQWAGACTIDVKAKTAKDAEIEVKRVLNAGKETIIELQLVYPFMPLSQQGKEMPPVESMAP